MRRYKYQLVFDETDEVYYDSETAWNVENLKKLLYFITSFGIWLLYFLHILCTMDFAKDFDSNESL